MIFAPDTEVALATVVDLINTVAMDTDGLLTLADLDQFVTEQRFFGSRTHSDAELRSVRQLRTQLRDIWVAPEDEAVEQVNFILRNARALPQLVKHDGLDYHIHATTQQTPLSERMAVEAAMALVDVIRSGERDRLRSCAASNCAAVLLDLSKNRSKLYCDTGNCANREHVRAYRQRKSAQKL
ncbi:CGNR zinc finger domain-containing protein [Paeniglutamicibacter kerguelensis]|uniref:RNA-binding Zn ribbon-like protein n=1 Tax=Paeniglutamicibacter kerguelensis TaxID=254788 RepID=A0ABS4XHX9_9MICC|nr:CGNR zinc finger domain-containing protein [Paeniglutamicibacter kerguelensis]MBP2388079.1 putative RNA-binding Zn ribbon-like protein [Paeniglutamicibacter kerguelensis]